MDKFELQYAMSSIVEWLVGRRLLQIGRRSILKDRVVKCEVALFPEVIGCPLCRGVVYVQCVCAETYGYYLYSYYIIFW